MRHSEHSVPVLVIRFLIKITRALTLFCIQVFFDIAGNALDVWKEFRERWGLRLHYFREWLISTSAWTYINILFITLLSLLVLPLFLLRSLRKRFF